MQLELTTLQKNDLFEMTFLNHKILVAFTLISLTVVSTSCFKDEPLNAECDIEQAWVHVSDLEANFYNANDTLISVLSNEDKVVFTMRDDADVTAFAPQFKITAGATITPESGSVHDFSNGPVTYTVTSQDGKWSRKYFVSCNRMARYSTSVIDFDFEHFELDKDYHKFYVWHNVLPDGSLGDDWATGNYGFYIANSNAPANDYPTFVLENGYEGHGIEFVTRDTGPWGSAFGKPIAAGNLFLGKFNIVSALTQPLKATEFGIPFTQKPVKLSGYYQYSPSAPFTDKDFNEHPERTDAGDIYSVLYINHDRNGNPLVLYGDNVLSSDNIVAVARVKNVNETNGEWVKFDIDFEYRKEINPTILANRGYNLTIVFSSSIDGATFEGAIGSTLKVDSVKLTCEEKE